MEKVAVLAKTAKGHEEIKSRTHGLPQKLRAVLILVDGNTTAADLLAKFGGLTEIEQSLDALVAQGFAEVRAIRAAPPLPAAAATPTRSGPATEPQTREAARSALVREVRDTLGPDADVVTGDLERARTGSDFAVAVRRCAEMLGAVRGTARAQAFRERAEAYAEQHLAR